MSTVPAACSAGGLVTGAVLGIAGGLFFAIIGVVADMGVVPLVFAVLWGLVLVRVGFSLIARPLGGLRAGSLTDLACLGCGTVWTVAENSVEGASPTGRSAAPPSAVIPAQNRPGDASGNTRAHHPVALTASSTSASSTGTSLRSCRHRRSASGAGASRFGSGG